MSYNKKREHQSGGHGGSYGASHRGDSHPKRPKQAQRGPSNIQSHFSVIRRPHELRERVNSDTHTLILEKFDILRDEELVLDVKWPICSLSIVDLAFPSPDRLPPSLLSFVRDCPTLQELRITWTRLSSRQWSSLIENIVLNAGLQTIAFRDASIDSTTLQPLLSHPTLSRLSLGEFEISQPLLEALFTSKTMKALEFQHLRLPLSFGEILAKHLESTPTRVSELVVEREKEVNLETQGSKLEKFILSGSLSSSIPSDAPLILSKDSVRPLVWHSLGSGSENLLSSRVIESSPSFELPPGVIAVIPQKIDSNRRRDSNGTASLSENGATAQEPHSKISASFDPSTYQFGISKAHVIVVQRPAASTGMKLTEYMSMVLMPLLIRCMHFLVPNGHILVVDDDLNNLSSDSSDMRRACEQVTDEMIKRMNALFDARRVGFWQTSRSDRGQINIIKSSDAFPVVVEGSNTLNSESGLESLRIWCWKKVSTNLQVEYGRFLLSHELYRGFDAVSLKFNQQRDLQAILEQWFMLRANGEDADRYPVDELTTKRVCSVSEAEDWVSYITRKSLEVPLTPSNFAVTRRDVPGSAHHPSVAQLQYGQFEENVQASRADALLAAAVRLGAHHGLDDLLCMMMRYGTVFGNFRQFCTNEKLFQECVDVGVHCEGFASPFNAQILLSKPPVPIDQWQPTFCSCYEDTDAIFGSLGSFFFQSFNNMHTFLNPPTVDAVLTQTMNFIHDQMESGKCQFHVLLPAWDDLQAYQFGANSKRLTRLRRLDSQQYPSQNPYSGESHPSGKKFVLMSFASEGLVPSFSS